MIYKYQLAQLTANKIKKFRKLKGLTQEELAMMLGVSRTTLGNWESGTRIPPLDQYCELAYLLDCSLDELVKTDEQLTPEFLPSDDYNMDSLDLTCLNETERKIIIDLFNSMLKHGSFSERRKKFPRLDDDTLEKLAQSR